MNVEPGVPDGTRGEDSVFWDDAEDLLTKDYVGCIKRQEGMDQEAGTTLQNDKGHGVWKHSPNHAQNCYASFGDRGTTATVDAFGNIMQLSRFLGAGVGKSGMLCVDRVDALRVPAWTPVPYQVQDRMDWLNDLTEKVEQAERFGIVFERPLSDIMSNNSGSPDKKWLNWRWPCYEYRNSPDRHPKLPSSRIVIQWMVHNGTVLQKTTVRNLGERPFNAKFQFSGHILIRELDCFDNNHSFNNADSNDEAEAYSSRIGPHGYSWVCVHKFPATGAQQNSSTEAGPPSSNQAGEESLESRSSPPFAAATVVTIFKNGEALKFPGSDPKNPYSWRHNIKPGGKMELVIAFRLIKLDQSQESWKNFVIPACDADVDKFLNEEKLQPTDLFISQLRSDNKDSSDNNQEKSSTRYTSPVGRFDRSPDNHIEFMVRRNLEHILSVCAIPLTEPSLESDGTKPAQGDSSGIRTPSRLGTPEMVALTCGDISGHLVSNSASFFAFSFLVEIAKRLRNLKSTRSEVQNLLERIYSVCRGHLRWIQNTKKMPNGCFAPNYRVTGEFINEPPDPWTWLEPEALTDTPFQLLKATQFSSIMQNDEDREVAHGPVLGVLTEWLTALEKADRRGKFAWPHATKEDMKIFRLDDHLWIFFALKSVLNLGESFLQAYDDQLRNEDQQSNEDQLFNEDRLSHDDRLSDEKKPKVKISRMRASVSFRVGTGEQKFNANDLQMEVLRRFTAENGNVRRRMLALTRSPRETRFLLHARDTAFFYGEEWSFLTDLTYKELWDATLQVQAEHDENDDGTWTTTLRFALAIAMGSLEKRINKKTPRELVKTALDVLFRLTGFNGVVPGESDEAIDEAMQPKIFDDERYRHFYFHAGFEVPFLLLTYAGRVKKVMDPIKVPMPAQQPRLDTRGTEEVLDLLRKISRELSQRNRSSAIKNHRLIMKKSIPFNIQIDSTSIVEIGDEWLFNYPAFFGYESDETTDFPSALKIARDDLKEHSQTKFIQRAIDEVDAEQEANGQGSEASRHGQLHARQQMPATRRQKDSTDTEIDAKILDIPKYKHLGKRRDTRSIGSHHSWNNNDGLWTQISAPRTAAKAKKRFIWLRRANLGTALRCCLATPSTENLAISRFFDRHASYEKYMFDDTTMIHNLWETELHLSFYLLVESRGNSAEGIPNYSGIGLPGAHGKQITRASVGFRFHGDFFDRYWTCHFIEYIATPPHDVRDDIPRDIPLPQYWHHKKHGQRKVLENQIFNRILQNVTTQTRKVVGEIKSVLGIHEDSTVIDSFTLASRDYFSSSSLWEGFRPILHLINEDIDSTLAIVSKWSTREARREQERPRWTSNDEGKYRAFIQKEIRTTTEIINELEAIHKGAQALEKSLDDSFDRWREQLVFSDNQHIISFTYVTVVFLPLGFAASMFSMSGPPDRLLVGNMAIWAGVALGITLLVLAYADGIIALVKLLRKPLVGPGVFIRSVLMTVAHNSHSPPNSHAETPASLSVNDNSFASGRGEQYSTKLSGDLLV